jgi:hypothetical protein
MAREFPSATIVAVGRTALSDESFHRVLHVEAATAAGGETADKPLAATPVSGGGS